MGFPVKIFRAIQDIADKVISSSCGDSEDSYVLTQEQKTELISYIKCLGFEDVSGKLGIQLPALGKSEKKSKKVTKSGSPHSCILLVVEENFRGQDIVRQNLLLLRTIQMTPAWVNHY